MTLSSRFKASLNKVLNERALRRIEEAGSETQRVQITYLKKNGSVVQREIRPYEIKPHRTSGTLMVYGTDTLHGAGQIHSFIAGNIQAASQPLGSFKPIWPVVIGEE